MRYSRRAGGSSRLCLLSGGLARVPWRPEIGGWLLVIPDETAAHVGDLPEQCPSQRSCHAVCGGERPENVLRRGGERAALGPAQRRHDGVGLSDARRLGELTPV